MARRNGNNAKLTAGIKTNEHGSAVGKTPPVQLYVGGLATWAGHQAAFEDFRSMIAGLVVAGSLASVSVMPDADALVAGVSYQEAASKNDWPEANENRIAQVQLSNAEKTQFRKITIPYVDPATSEDDIRSALLTYLGTYDVRRDDTAASARMTDVIGVTISSR